MPADASVSSLSSRTLGLTNFEAPLGGRLCHLELLQLPAELTLDRREMSLLPHQQLLPPSAVRAVSPAVRPSSTQCSYGVLLPVT